MAKTRKLPASQKVDCLVPVKITPVDYKRFMKAMKAAGIPYATEFARKIVLEYLDKLEAKHEQST